MMFYICQACCAGEHNLCAGRQPPPPGMMGGSECDCDGKCGERAKPDPQISEVVRESMAERTRIGFGDGEVVVNMPLAEVAELLRDGIREQTFVKFEWDGSPDVFVNPLQAKVIQVATDD